MSASEGSWPEQEIIDKFVELWSVEAPREAIVKLKNDLTALRIDVQQKHKQAESEVLAWIEACEELSSNVDMDVKLTSENELIRKLAKKDFSFGEKLRWNCRMIDNA